MLVSNQILQARYRIVRQLGHGGMGAVYEAIDERFGEPIALKEILCETANEKQKSLFVKAFEREAKSLAKAKHEVVPFVRDYFFELNRQFLVMELVDGDDLSELLEKRKSFFPLKDALRWLDQLLDAIDYLHNLKPSIIHRDIKPQNLKLTYRCRIKLLDFGIAKTADSGTDTTTNQTFVGATLNYSPTEQILRVIDSTFRDFILLKHKEKAQKILDQNTDARCDIYALGATFYHLLTNHLPIDSIKRTLEVWENRSDPLLNPTKINPNIPFAISACLLKAMELDRDNRFSTAIEMQEALQSAIKKTEEKDAAGSDSVVKRESLFTTQEMRFDQILASPQNTDIFSEEQLKTKAGETLSYDHTLPLPTQPSIVIDSRRNISAEFRSNESSATKKSGTSHITSSAELTEKNEPNTKKGFFWLVPLIILAVLTVSGGVVGIFWMSDSTPAKSDSSNGNTSVQPSPSPAQTIEAIIKNVNQKPTTVNTATPKEIFEPKPVAKNTPQITKTPAPQKKLDKPNSQSTQTSKPKPKTPATIGPCAFTDDCE